MRKALLIPAILAMVLASARADLVKVGGLAYRDVKVTGFSLGNLTFMPRQSPITKPLDKVTLIEMEGKADFNEAEKLRVEKPAEAAGLYDAAENAAWGPWERDLIAYRRLDALGRAGLVDRWAREWTKLLAEGHGQAVGKLRPGKARDELELKAAIRHLEVALPHAKDANARVEIENVLKQLRGEPAPDKVEPPEGNGQKPEGQNGQKPPDGPESQGPRPVLTAGDSEGRLAEFEKMFKEGKTDQVITGIDEFLKAAGSRELPRAMLLGGLARMEKAKVSRNPRLLNEAALLFMKVAVLCPGSADAPAALYNAGQVSELLGDKSGAIAAYQDLTVRGGESDFVKLAAERLKALQAEGSKDETEGKPVEKG